MNNDSKVVVFPHRPSRIGGPGSFQTHLESKLVEDGHIVSYASDKIRVKPDTVLIVGGTRKVFWLLLQKLRGVRIVHRLDGKNWQESMANDGFLRMFKSRLINYLLWGIKSCLADAVIYQSKFIESIWNKKEFPDKSGSKRGHIIYNSVPLHIFYPIGKDCIKNNVFEIVCIEGNVKGSPAIKILRSIHKLQVNVFGQVSNEVLDSFEKNPKTNILFQGEVERDYVPRALSGFKIFLNLETNPPCPNAVIEALAAGVPVIGFDSGSLKELVGDGGIVLAYGSANSWSLEPPDCELLNNCIEDITSNYGYYSQNARKRAELMFSLDTMYQKYCEVLFKI